MGWSRHRVGPADVWCTDRHGGVSTGRYSSANLGDHVGDDAAHVAANRARLAAALDRPHGWWYLRQVHGARVVDATGAPPAEPPVADAAVTADPGVVLAVLVADCAPVLVAGDDAIAVVHAGWQGLRAGVVEAAVARLRPRTGGPLRALLGPCIRAGRYEFGAEPLAAMVDRFGAAVRGTTEWGTPALDVPAAVRAALADAGITDLVDAGVCTSASPDHFSHRRDGITGRQALVAVLAP